MAKAVGEKLFLQFVSTRLQSDSVKFSETLKKRNVLTFEVGYEIPFVEEPPTEAVIKKKMRVH